MRDVRAGLARMDPAAASRLRSGRFTFIEEIQGHTEVMTTWRDIAERREMFGQYAWLTRYALQHPEIVLEIGFNRDDAAKYAPMLSILKESQGPNATPTWSFPPDHGAPDLALLDSFQYPMINITKPDMRRLADQRGFLFLLEKSWFCRHPMRGKPCGYCRLCRDSMDQGMAYRFTWGGRVRHRFWKLFYLAKVIRENPGLVVDRVLNPHSRFRVGEFARDPRVNNH